jgi:hypothetical protein
MNSTCLGWLVAHDEKSLMEKPFFCFDPVNKLHHEEAWKRGSPRCFYRLKKELLRSSAQGHTHLSFKEPGTMTGGDLLTRVEGVEGGEGEGEGKTAIESVEGRGSWMIAIGGRRQAVGICSGYDA